MTILEDIEGYTSYRLAGMADCSAPDSLSSPGARVLDSVRDGVVDLIKRGEITFNDFDDSGQLHQIADGGPSIYTETMWREFVDLAAYQEEPEFDADWGTDLNRAAATALYQICSRLTFALAEEWRDGWECPMCGADADGGCDQDTCCGSPVCGTCGGEGGECAETCAYDTPADGPEVPIEPLPIRTRGDALTAALAEYVTCPDGPSMEVDDMYVIPVSDVLTGPVDLPPASDPILSLIETAEAEDMGRRVGRHARLADAAVSRFRWRVWTTTAVLAVVSVAVILREGGVW